MSKPLIAVDIDEVLFPFVREFAAHHNTQFGTSLTENDFWTYQFEHVIGVELPEILARVYAFHDLGYQSIQPLADAQAALHELAKTYQIAILTARKATYRLATEAWLSAYFDVSLHSVTMIGYEEDQDHPQTKAEVCVRIGAEVLIDDSLKYLTEAAEAGVRGVLFGDYPWNSGTDLPDGITRCKDWSEVLEYFNERT